MIQIQIEFGNHKQSAQVPALPRAGDFIACSFPRSGIPELGLKVTRVHFHMDGNQHRVVVTTDDDPSFRESNAAVFKKLVGGSA